MTTALAQPLTQQLPELLRVLPELRAKHNESYDLRVKLARHRADLLSRGLNDPKCPWDVFIRAVVEIGQLSPQRIGFVTGASASSVSRWLAGKVEPHEDAKSIFAQKLIAAVEKISD